MMDDSWIDQHVRPCMENSLKRSAVLDKIIPAVDKLLGCKEEDFVHGLATEFRSHLQDPDFKPCVLCIEHGVIFEMQARNIPDVKGWAFRMCAPLMGKFFYIHAVNTGYI